jgi:death-on-curing protein
LAPLFLTLEEVVEIHRDQIERYGGHQGILDVGLLQSAIAAPQAGLRGAYLHGDLSEMAAAYLLHPVRNHPFVDGNKRVGAAAALVFLILNGVAINPPEDELVDVVLQVAQGRMQKGEVATFFRRHTPRTA